MSNVCAICGKSPEFGNNVSHSNKKTRRVFKPNIIKAKVEYKGKIQNIRICAKCLKSGKVKKVVWINVLLTGLAFFYLQLKQIAVATVKWLRKLFEGLRPHSLPVI